MTLGYDTLSLLDYQGQLIWTTSVPDFYRSYQIGSEAIIIDANNALLAFNITDGLPRWRHDVSEYTSVRNMVITDDGQVIVTLQDAILFFNE